MQHDEDSFYDEFSPIKSTKCFTIAKVGKLDYDSDINIVKVKEIYQAMMDSIVYVSKFDD